MFRWLLENAPFIYPYNNWTGALNVDDEHIFLTIKLYLCLSILITITFICLLLNFLFSGLEVSGGKV